MPRDPHNALPKTLNWCALIPAYAEENYIGEVVRSACAHGASVLVVDDGSPDATAQRAEEAGAQVIRHSHNRGKGAALETGCRVAREQRFEVVVTLDADGQHDPAELPKFIDVYQRTGIPVLLGNRMAAAEDMPWLRRFTNRFMSWLLGRIMGCYVPDTQCGYRLYRMDVLQWLGTGEKGFAAESEVLLRLAARGVRMDSVRIRTLYGKRKSKIRPGRDTLRFVRMLLHYRREMRNRKRTQVPEKGSE